MEAPIPSLCPAQAKPFWELESPGMMGMVVGPGWVPRVGPIGTGVIVAGGRCLSGQGG